MLGSSEISLQPPVKRQRTECCMDFLDLPEDIFIEIFGYFTDADIYFTLRNVCYQIQTYADRYVQLGIEGLIAGGRGERNPRSYSDRWNQCDLQSEILYIFKRNGRPSSLLTKLGPFLPAGCLVSLKDYGVFGRACNGRIFFGDRSSYVLECSLNVIRCHDYHAIIQESVEPLLGRQSSLLISFDPKWRRRVNTDPEVTLRGIKRKSNLHNSSEFFPKRPFTSTLLPINVPTRRRGLNKEAVRMYHFDQSTSYYNILDLKYASVYNEKKEENSENEDECTQYKDVAGSPRERAIAVRHNTMTNLGFNKILLVGGFVKFNETISRATNMVLKGSMHNMIGNSTRVTWEELSPMSQPRGYHVTFKMRNHVYVAGGKHWKSYKALVSCEMYDVNNNKWYPVAHSLPYPLHSASVMVSQDETFAVITGGITTGNNVSNGVILFTEKEGFFFLKGSNERYNFPDSVFDSLKADYFEDENLPFVPLKCPGRHDDKALFLSGVRRLNGLKLLNKKKRIYKYVVLKGNNAAKTKLYFRTNSSGSYRWSYKPFDHCRMNSKREGHTSIRIE